MREFMIEDRRSGAVIAEGTISPTGDVSMTESSMSPEEQTRAIAQIERDVAGGYSGGRLDIRDLEWMEWMRRSDA